MSRRKKYGKRPQNVTAGFLACLGICFSPGGGGDKSTQEADVEKAKEILEELEHGTT
jgi:putative component of toxin-antitoxin plasmid stabilization module